MPIEEWGVGCIYCKEYVHVPSSNAYAILEFITKHKGHVFKYDTMKNLAIRFGKKAGISC